MPPSPTPKIYVARSVSALFPIVDLPRDLTCLVSCFTFCPQFRIPLTLTDGQTKEPNQERGDGNPKSPDETTVETDETTVVSLRPGSVQMQHQHVSCVIINGLISLPNLQQPVLATGIGLVSTE